MAIGFRAALSTAAVILLGALPVAGQKQTAVTSRWSQRRTPDGQPDLQGIWTMATFTPLERPSQVAGKEFFTEQEFTELNQLLTAEGVDPLVQLPAILSLTPEERQARLRQGKDNLHYDNALFLRERQPKGLSTRRTSLIVDPPDGRIPPLTLDASRRESERRKAKTFPLIGDPESTDSYEHRKMDERCLVYDHQGPPMLPALYLDQIQIVQSRGYVAILQEVKTHQMRIIPLDGRPHLSKDIRQWPGDSRGRWEGDTLVVDTTNFTYKTHFKGSSEALHVVERFTRVDAKTIKYEFTVDDPTAWTRPWSAEVPMKKSDGPLFEFACHEGNHDLPNILEGARNVEAQQAAKKLSN